ncbi:MAG: transporter [Candidatus Hydrogenedentota bacterium]
MGTGCKTGPDYARPDVDIPTEWASPREGGAVDQSTDLSQWWTLLNDPVLTELIGKTLENNLEIRTAEARVREARAARRIAGSALWPTLNAAASWTERQVVEPDQQAAPPISFGLSTSPNGISRSLTTRRGDLSTTTTITGQDSATSYNYTPGSTPEKFDRTSGLYQAGFDASWEIDVFGGNRRATEAASAVIEAEIERRRDVQVTMAAEVALNYIELRSTQRRLEITEKNVQAQAKTVQLTQARFDAGLTSELDVTQARAQLAATQSQLPVLHTQIESSIHRLGVLAGEVPGSFRDTLYPSLPIPVTPAEIPVGLPSELLLRRPDIRTAERELAAATARIGAAKADLFPKFYLTGAFAGQSPSLGNVWSTSNQLWSVGPSIHWPIFQGGRILANVEVQDARQEQALIAYERTILFALEDVENSLVSFAQQQIRRRSLEEAVKANEKAVQLANERYVRGLEGFLNVLQAQLQLFLSEDQLVQSESFVLTDLIALYKALGGGWDTPSPETETSVNLTAQEN